ncbi:MAG: NAD(P)H-dependent oxidoreductase [Lentisphaeria bacterium]|nr:NAD(P)H-dependent oxidoreductase [Lentisphaeria bacterium]
MNRREFIRNVAVVAAGAMLGIPASASVAANTREEKKRMKAIFINGSPRKNRNTASLLKKVMDGAADAGCETKLVHLRDLKFSGCISCLACKLKGNTCAGLCALQDDLRPVLEETLASDIIVIGTPVYWHYPTALTRAFMERLLFAPLDYANPGSSVLAKKIRCATIYTMHVMNDELFAKQGYAQTLGVAAKSLEFLGPQETLYFRGLSVFPETGTDRYAASDWFNDLLAKERREHYAEYERQAYELGKRLVEKTIS